MDIEVVNAIIFNDKEYAIIDMTCTLDKINSFSLKQLGIQRGRIFYGDYVQSVNATWIISSDLLWLKQISYKKNTFTFSKEEATQIGLLDDGGVTETIPFMVAYEFTGRLRLARDSIKGQFNNDKKMLPLAFHTIIDITIYKDQAYGLLDRSQEVEEWRRALQNKGPEPIVPLNDL